MNENEEQFLLDCAAARLSKIREEIGMRIARVGMFEAVDEEEVIDVCILKLTQEHAWLQKHIMEPGMQLKDSLDFNSKAEILESIRKGME